MEMYTGTLISELIATVERVGQQAVQDRMAAELHEIFTMQIPVENDQAYMGAA
jgi:hypothetical protein